MKFFRSFALVLILANGLFASKMTIESWKKGQTFSEYLNTRSIHPDILKSISKEDVKFLSEIESKQRFYELRDTHGDLEQALIPIGEEMQIRVAKVRESGLFNFDIIPIEYKQEEYSATVSIENSPYIDIKNELKHTELANKMGQLLKGAVNTKKLRKGDTLSFIYVQKTRMGLPNSMPKVKVAMLHSRGKNNIIFSDEDGYGVKEGGKTSNYSKNGDYVKKVRIKTDTKTFRMPLRHVRITSKFTHRRWHPILKRYRPHHGTDFGARRGTPLLSVYDGKVSFAGRMGGYGKVVKIKHPHGYESLYAHQSRIKVRRGQRVKKGQIIGYVGSTGRSTGPHLHFGLKKNGRWVNPTKVLRKENMSKKVKYRKIVVKDAKDNKVKLLNSMKRKEKPFIWDIFTQTSMRISDANKYQKL